MTSLPCPTDTLPLLTSLPSTSPKESVERAPIANNYGNTKTATTETTSAAAAAAAAEGSEKRQTPGVVARERLHGRQQHQLRLGSDRRIATDVTAPAVCTLATTAITVAVSVAVTSLLPTLLSPADDSVTQVIQCPQRGALALAMAGDR